MSTELIDPRHGLPSASVMRRVSECPGSEALIAALRRENKLKGEPVSPEAASGLRIHALLAAPIGFVFSEPITESEMETARACLEIKDSLLRQWAGEQTERFFTLIEARIFYYSGDEAIFTGQPDFVAIDFKNSRALVLNYKTGRKASDQASDNLQLRTEVVLVKHAYQSLTEIDAAIVEPLVDWDSVRVRYSERDLAEAEANICAIVGYAHVNPGNRCAGDWCTYCPARVYCPEARTLALSVLQYDEVQPADLPRGQEGTLLYEKLKLVKKLIAALEKTYTKILEAEPDALPGYKLPAQGPGHWVVPEPKAFREAFMGELSAEEIDGALSWNIAKLRELYGMKYHLRGRELVDKFRRLAGDSIQLMHGAPFIRPLYKKEKFLLSLNLNDDSENSQD